MRWILVARQFYNRNIPEYGCGDYPESIPYIAAVISADTRRKAQTEAKKLFPTIRFAGMFAPRLLEFPSEYSSLYTKSADTRLSREAVHMHRAALEQLT